jgi:hypothetical protein
VKKELVATTDKVERLTMIQDHEHEIDVMARYFLSYYYSGDKDKLKAYLDNNDAKFTNPEVATVSSTMLEKVELVKNEKDTYEVHTLLVQRMRLKKRQFVELLSMLRKNHQLLKVG